MEIMLDNCLDRDQATQVIKRMWELCAKPKEFKDDGTKRFPLVLEVVMDLPAFAVIQVFRDWNSKFFPVPQEIKIEAEKVVARHRAQISGLKRALELRKEYDEEQAAMSAKSNRSSAEKAAWMDKIMAETRAKMEARS